MTVIRLGAEQLPLASLAPFPGNPRRGNTAAIRESIRRFGQYRSLLVRAVDGQRVIVAGNHTSKALAAEGYDTAWCELIECTDEDARAVNAADNRLGELPDPETGERYDRDALAGLLGSLDDLAGTGWSQADLDSLLDDGEPEGNTDPDDVPEPPAEPVTRPGDLWQLGPHRLLCGDSTVATDVERLLGDATPWLMVTDPPYGVDYDPNWRNEAADKGLIAHAASRVGEVRNDNRIDWREAWALSPARVVYCWHADRHASAVQESLEAAGYEIRCQVIWAKSRFAISRGHYHWQHEPCWYGVRKGHTANWVGDRSQVTLWQITLDLNVQGGHSTQKPVECMERPLRNHQGDVYDPFAGTGSTIIAAHRTQRRAYAMEIDPAYCDVICQRYADHAGIKPELLS